MEENLLKQELASIVMAFFTEYADCDAYVNRLSIYAEEKKWQTVFEDFCMVRDSHQLTDIDIVYPQEFHHSFQIRFTYATTEAHYRISAYFSVLIPYYAYTVEETFLNPLYTIQEESQRRVMDKLERFVKERRMSSQLSLSSQPIEKRLREHLLDIKALIEQFGHEFDLTFDELLSVPYIHDLFYEKPPQNSMPAVASPWEVFSLPALENLFDAIHTVQKLSINYERFPVKFINQSLGMVPVSCLYPQELTCRQALFKF